MTKARRRRPNLPKPMPRPMDNPPEYEESADEHRFEEPVFDEAEDAGIAGASTLPRADKETTFEEPVFDLVWPDNEPEFDPNPSKAVAVGSSSSAAEVVKSSAMQSSAAAQAENAGMASGEYRSGRRLGRTTPFWLMAAGLALVLVTAFWLLFLRGDNDTADRQLTPAAGIVGSTELSDAPAAEAVAEPTPTTEPTATPVPILNAGQLVVVANTAGNGLSLRSQPGTSSQRLGIFQDGAQFTILNPDGNYDSYPVEADGYRWYRIQIANTPDDNRTGWAVGDFLQPTE